MHNHKHACKTIDRPGKPTIYFQGPPLSSGRMPAVFYFALSGKDSLCLVPYCQPALFLADKKCRVFSLTIPGHGEGFENHRAMALWARELNSGIDLISPFIKECKESIDFLINEGWIETDRIAAAGLSRGGFIAAHLAAVDDRVKTLLCFAPLTILEALEEFKSFPPSQLVKSFSLMTLVPLLSHKIVRCYIGNRDTCVGTDHCYEWIKALTESAYLNRHRSPPMEMNIFPSIGHKGHGTPPEIFHQGIAWLSRILT